MPSNYKNPAYPLRIRQDIIDKMKFIAFDSSRSLNKEIEQACIKHVAKWESDNYDITIDDLRRMDD